ncbi:hypothetical protein OPQ81_006326 [Rhizoctonia solani]|nr:hypothetical protein OPQ81_006326 [Rhizoctonia solani]
MFNSAKTSLCLSIGKEQRTRGASALATGKIQRLLGDDCPTQASCLPSYFSGASSDESTRLGWERWESTPAALTLTVLILFSPSPDPHTSRSR